MPHKHHAARRHRIPTARYHVPNWQQYEAGLRQRGSLTLWSAEAAIAAQRIDRGRGKTSLTGTAACPRNMPSDLVGGRHAVAVP
jgi:hypothetical protein